MLLRVLTAVLAGMLASAARADVPPPPSCEQLYLAVDDGLLTRAGVDAGPLLQQLGKASGLQLHVTGGKRDEFDAGVLDLWLALEAGSAKSGSGQLLQPPLWQEQMLLWVRAGELVSLEHWPQLEGLRGGSWAQQQKSGVLRSLLPVLHQQQLRPLPDQSAALQALLAGEIDFFVARDDSRQGALQQARKDGLIEALTQPVRTRSYHLAVSKQSACRDSRLVGKLEQALASVQKNRRKR